MATLYFDGGYKDGVGTYAYILDNSVITIHNGVIPGCENSTHAEYWSLILGIGKAIDLGIFSLEIKGDARTVLHQLTGQKKVKKTHSLHREAMGLLELMPVWSIEWVPRSANLAGKLLEQS